MNIIGPQLPPFASRANNGNLNYILKPTECIKVPVSKKISYSSFIDINRYNFLQICFIFYQDISICVNEINKKSLIL